MVVYMDPLSHCIAPTRDSRDSVNIPSSLGFTAHGALFLILSPSVSAPKGPKDPIIKRSLLG